MNKACCIKCLECSSTVEKPSIRTSPFSIYPLCKPLANCSGNTVFLDLHDWGLSKVHTQNARPVVLFQILLPSFRGDMNKSLSQIQTLVTFTYEQRMWIETCETNTNGEYNVTFAGRWWIWKSKESWFIINLLKKHIDRCMCDDVCARFHSYIIIGRVDTQIYTYAMIFTVRCHRYSNYW